MRECEHTDAGMCGFCARAAKAKIEQLTESLNAYIDKRTEVLAPTQATQIQYWTKRAEKAEAELAELKSKESK